MPLQDKGRIGQIPGVLFGLLVFGGVPLFLLIRTMSLEAAYKHELRRAYPTGGLVMDGEADTGAPRASDEPPLVVGPVDAHLTLTCRGAGRAVPGDAVIYFSRYPAALGGTVEQLKLRNLVQCKSRAVVAGPDGLQLPADEVLPVLRRIGRGAEWFIWPRVVYYRVVLDPKHDTPPTMLPAALEVQVGFADHVRDLLFKLASMGWLVGYFYAAFVRSSDLAASEREDTEAFYQAAGVIGSAVLLFMPVLDYTASSTGLGWAMRLVGYQPVELTPPHMTTHWLGPIMMFGLPLCTLGHLLSALPLVLIRYGISLGRGWWSSRGKPGKFAEALEEARDELIAIYAIGIGIVLVRLYGIERALPPEHAGLWIIVLGIIGIVLSIVLGVGTALSTLLIVFANFLSAFVIVLPLLVPLDWLTGQPGVWSTILWPVAIYVAIRMGKGLRRAIGRLRGAMPLDSIPVETRRRSA